MKLISKGQLSPISQVEIRGSHYYVRKIARPGYEPDEGMNKDELIITTPSTEKIMVETDSGIFIELDQHVVLDLVNNVEYVKILDNETEQINYYKPVFSDGERTCYSINQLCFQIIKYILFKRIYSGPNEKIEDSVEIGYITGKTSTILNTSKMTFDMLISKLCVSQFTHISSSSGTREV